MEDDFKEFKPKIKVLSIYQIVGGGIGLAITIWIMVNYLSAFNGMIFLLFLLALGLYSYSIYCGILLLKNYKSGLKHSLINQALQVLNFAIPGYSFLFVAGIYISIGVDLTESIIMKFNFGFSTWKIDINTGEPFVYA
ncbi:MAG TPA: hypothetical protein VJU78_10575, partial [Chitinophagaceae bacterium]|nr:hypothetical protein [Chitinophagaceae bacterium]